MAFILDAQYPNLAAEIYFHSYHIDTFSSNANISSEILREWMDGNGVISEEEFRNLCFYFVREDRLSYTYLKRPKLTYYDLKKSKHYHKVLIAYKALEKSREGVPAKDSSGYSNIGFCEAEHIKPLNYFIENYKESYFSVANLHQIYRAVKNLKRDKRIMLEDLKKQKKRTTIIYNSNNSVA